MIGDQNESKMERINTIEAAAEGYTKHLRASHSIWSTQLGKLEISLKDLNDKLFGDDMNEVSITGQDLVVSAAERAVRLTKEASSSLKTTHQNCLKIGKNVDKFFEREPSSVFKLDVDLTKDSAQSNQCFSLIYDFIVADGMEKPAEKLKQVFQVVELEKEDEEDSTNLKQIVDDLRQGEIRSALEMIRKTYPCEEDSLRTNLQTQLITDCIELDNYRKAVDQMKLFKEGWLQNISRAPRLVGALLIGRLSMFDARYKELFDYANREQLSLKLATFFMPNDAPLKMILRYGSQALTRLSVFGSNCPNNRFYVENELPMEVSMNPAHSAFTCPILKEQCNNKNPAMRLICGHVISKDAIHRLTTSLRPVRNTARAARFKCPYCPREQFMENAKIVNFHKWVAEDDDEDYLEDMDIGS